MHNAVWPGSEVWGSRHTRTGAGTDTSLVGVVWQSTWVPNHHPAGPATKCYRSWKNEWECNRKCHRPCQLLERAGLSGVMLAACAVTAAATTLRAPCCQISWSTFLCSWYLETAQDEKKVRPVFALLHSVAFCVWWFCCLTQYKRWLQRFLYCALNLGFTPFFLSFRTVARGSTDVCLCGLPVGC